MRFPGQPLALCALLALTAAAPGKVVAQERDRGLADLSIEDLMNESVTSVGKKQSRLEEAATAISVITQEDIRRSGYNSIPELLRLVPGLDVARVNANQWAISARGANSQFADELLVLVDGRTVYTPSSAGVFWNVQDLMLEDIERIEVIRGPGAALWGANAVNGVINIITKAARDTQGALLSASVGTEDQPAVAARYGSQLGTQAQYRVYMKYLDREPFVDHSGNDVTDAETATRVGGRLDWQAGASDEGTLLADYYYSEAHNPITLTSFAPPYAVAVDAAGRNQGVDALGRWTHSFSSASQLQVQSYFQHFEENYGPGVEYEDSYDFDIQHHVKLGGRNDVVWGGGYRYTVVRTPSNPTIVWTPQMAYLSLFQAFAQDEITLVPERLRAVLGSRLEHNDLTGFEVEPNARLLWTPSRGGTLWAALSRATRTPSLFERDSQVNAAVVQQPAAPPIWIGRGANPRLDVESVLAYELGYRAQPARTLSIDLATYFNVYDHLVTYVAQPQVLQLTHVLASSTPQNVDNAHTYGLEISAQWQVRPDWRLAGSYTAYKIHTWPDRDVDNGCPPQQAQLHSYLDLTRHFEIDASASYVDALTVTPVVTPVRIRAYVRLDLGVSWHPSAAVEVGIWGQNLQQSRHAEFPSSLTPLQVEVPRSALGRIQWHF
jgi:iron complex outermembrane receptor protein